MDANLKAATYFILQSQMACGACDRLTPVFALALPKRYSSLVEKKGAAKWTVRQKSALIADLEYVPPAVASRIKGLTPHYRLDPDCTTRRKTWVNHCEHCGDTLADYAVQDMDEGEGPFDLLSDPTVQVHEVPEPFEGFAIESHIDPKILRSSVE